MESNNGIKDLLCISSSLAIIILLVSVGKIVAYWDAFKVPIANYLTFSDLPLHAYALVLNAKWYVLMIFIGYFFLPDAHKLLTAPNINFGVWLIILFLVFIISIVITCFYWKESLIYKGKDWLMAVVFVGGLSFFLLIYLVKLRFKLVLNYSGSVLLYFTFFCMYLFAVSRIIAKTEISLVKRGYYSETLIRFKDNRSALISDSTSYYIGNTLNFVFFYDSVDNSTQVIPISDVSELIIHTQIH